MAAIAVAAASVPRSGRRDTAARLEDVGGPGALGPHARAEKHRLVTIHSLRESQRRLRVLVAEDNAVNQLLAVRLLEKGGHEVVVAATGTAALEALEHQSFDLVLMDMQMPEMPEMGGLEATIAVRERERASASGQHIPIIAMTANAMVGDKVSRSRSRSRPSWRPSKASRPPGTRSR